MTESRTHLAIDHGLCGAPRVIGDGEGEARFVTMSAMAVDDRGLVHGGFVFGLVDHAAMVAVNDPNVVLGSADVRFAAPVAVGAEVVATAQVTESKGKKRVLAVRAVADGKEVLTGTLTAFVLPNHVLDG